MSDVQLTARVRRTQRNSSEVAVSIIVENRSAWNTMGAVDLPTLCQQAELLNRVDRKYIVNQGVLDQLGAYLDSAQARILEIGGQREFLYISDYFDTPALKLYYDAATGRRRRFKLRTRVYADSGDHFLELKTRGSRGHNVKDRLALEPIPAYLFARAAQGAVRTLPLRANRLALEWVHTVLADRAVAVNPGLLTDLAPVLRSVYRRSTVLTSDGSRLTIDTGLRLTPFPGAVDPAMVLRKNTLEMPTIIETKSSGRASQADRFLWSVGVRPRAISKFAYGIATAYGVPANKWSRTLRAIREANTKWSDR